MQASQTVALFSYLRGKRVSGRAPLVSDLMLRLACNLMLTPAPISRTSEEERPAGGSRATESQLRWRGSCPRLHRSSRSCPRPQHAFQSDAAKKTHQHSPPSHSLLHCRPLPLLDCRPARGEIDLAPEYGVVEQTPGCPSRERIQEPLSHVQIAHNVSERILRQFVQVAGRLAVTYASVYARHHHEFVLQTAK